MITEKDYADYLEKLQAFFDGDLSEAKFSQYCELTLDKLMHQYCRIMTEVK